MLPPNLLSGVKFAIKECYLDNTIITSTIDLSPCITFCSTFDASIFLFYGSVLVYYSILIPNLK